MPIKAGIPLSNFNSGKSQEIRSTSCSPGSSVGGSNDSESISSKRSMGPPLALPALESAMAIA